MTKIIALSTLAIFANLFQIAHASAQTPVAMVEQVSSTVKTAMLLDNGDLNVYSYGRFMKSVKLSDDNAKSLIALAQSLATAEIVVEHRQYVCMMIVAGFTSQNLSILTADGQSRLTLSPSICSVPNYTHPKEQSQLETAKKLRDQIAALASQALD